MKFTKTPYRRCIRWTIIFFILAETRTLSAEIPIAVNADCDKNTQPSSSYITKCSDQISERVTLQCCLRHCVEWNGEWYKSSNNSTQYLGEGRSLWIYVNSTQHPVKYICNVNSSSECEGGSGSIDILKGSPPSILVVNASSGVLKAIDEAKFEFYFEVISYPSPASVPRVSFNNSDLPEKWQTFYRSTEWTIISLSQVNYYYHFYVGLSVEKFLSEEDSGTYSLTVENMCNSLSTGVSIEAGCNDTVHFLPGALHSYSHYHTVVGRDVEISYDCYGINVSNWWAINGFSLHDQAPMYEFNMQNEKLKHCISTLTLRLLNVKLNYTGDYIAYPSKVPEFSTDGVHKTVHLMVHKYPTLLNKTLEIQDGAAYLGCYFEASNYVNLIIPLWTRSKGGSPIIPTPRTLTNNSTWHGPDNVLIQMTIKEVSSKDSGTYYCSLQYDTAIINGSKAVSSYGNITLHIGSDQIPYIAIIAGVTGGSLGLLIAVLLIYCCIKKLRKKYGGHPLVQLELVKDEGDPNSLYYDSN
ncbi:uncharacterized protein [Dysidea avara]|uniref:uncharacterized protein isoform X2 n=1 Tax=Dysidea avara TaxID=196820 RepID=UPI00332381C1